MDYQKLILKKLLDKYEKSKVYSNQTTQSRRILAKVAEFKKVDFEDFEQKSAFFEALEALKQLELLDFNWMPFEAGNLLKEIWLNQELTHIQRAYSYIGVKSTYGAFEEMVSLITAYEFTAYEWMAQFKMELLEKFNKTGKFGQVLFPDQGVNRRLIQCLIELDKLAYKAVHERVFSAKVFGDSKLFQNEIKSRLTVLIKRYNDVEEGEDLMSYVGLFSNPELIYFCGPVKIEFQNGVLEGSVFQNEGAVLIGTYVSEIIQITAEQNINYVISVENRATYELMIKTRPQEVLLLYHGGFAGEIKRAFFECIFSNFPDAAYYHWSDLDLGGVRILKALKQLIPVVKPLLMNETVLNAYRDFTTPLAKNYHDKIKNLLQREEDADVLDILMTLDRYALRLEQEHIEVSEAYARIFEEQ
ncbi:Wadjet anti-phage system protein JetD domain-containing protein [Fusibacter ferrireducens]|uniref:Wadjet protein JetD C-terminal domain-containing protein n=1 Tax=Fusibacter ferrireducens TaxID=2785058 RepID=A0ABR9ZXG8_9FIRM|nr:Wadjet anti-phage system protein JetD domain-containing protein [Fusibacter ferrireducens]MBF4695156.1 hypothetical protein [Fusibacter ferrireducens]